VTDTSTDISTDISTGTAGPKVVALGGGHGLAAALRGIRRYTESVTAVVSVADDGGSSGRLRRELGVLPPGDLRRCLVALATDDTWAHAFEHRFNGGELDGHALGNLVLVGLSDTLGAFPAALDEAGRLLGAVGRVLPATTEPVVLKGILGVGQTQGQVEGQVAVQNSRGIRRVELVPADAPACAEVVTAIADADQVVLAPGSLYTSLLPVLCVPALRDAIVRAAAPVVQLANLRPQIPETAGLDGAGHLAAVLDHGGRVDVFLYASDGALAVDEDEIRARGAQPMGAQLARADGLVHDSAQVARALSALL
jgi:uncharacterized cofD-like protein